MAAGTAERMVFASPVGEPRKRGRRSPWPLRLSLGYLAVVCLLGLATRFVAERMWWTTLLLYVPQVVYALPALIVVPMALRRRDGRALLAGLAGLGIVFGPLMGFNLPASAESVPSGTPRVRVLSYNIRSGKEGFHLISRQVEAFKPDVVVFSEARGFGRDQQLREELSRQFPGWSHVQEQDVYIASRWPIVGSEAEQLGPSRQRALVRALVEAPFGRFHVMGVHYTTAMHGETIVNQRRRLPRYIGRTGSVRLAQTRDLRSNLDDLTGPVILAGDFNTPPAGGIYRSLTRSLVDSFAAQGLGWGYTYPSRFSLLRIDYIFHSKGWKTLEARVGSSSGSDHRPIFAELALDRK